MRLAGVDIRNFRSIFDDEIERPLHLELGDGMNTLVGTNNCGKSNILRAISLALDPNHDFDPDRDAPAPRPFSLPTIKLTFVADGERAEEQQLLAAADEYESALGDGQQTYASQGLVILQVAFHRTGDGVRRSELLLTPRDTTRRRPEDVVRLGHALLRLREAVRFVLISSGESIESVLEGNFREILHSVVRERLHEEFTQAEGSRRDYITRLQDSLLGPLRDRLTDEVSQLFPEMAAAQLTPDVPSIERTLSRVGVQLDDIVTTPLSDKGTGVRGGVLVAMLSYLARNVTRGMVFAVEEPEAFLHPRAQEDVREHLEQIGLARDVTLLVTTHSPHILTREARGRIFCIAKDGAGRTRIAQSATGDAQHAPLIGDLYREASLADLLARSTNLPDGTQAVLHVEGDGDKRCLELATRVVGRPDLLAGIHIMPAGGAAKIVAEAVIMKAATDLPRLVLVDNDQAGKDAIKSLTGHNFNFNKKKEVASYVEVFPKENKHLEFAYEAEDLFDPALLEAFRAAHGGDAITDGSKKRPDGSFHYDFNQAAKEELGSYLEQHTRPQHVERWIELILLLRARLGLRAMEETAADIIAAAPEVEHAPDGPIGQRVLILPSKVEFGRYTVDGVVVLDPEQEIADDLTHVAFYVDGAIQPVVPRIDRRYQGIHFSAETVRQLEETGQAGDRRAADVIRHSLRTDDSLVGKSHHVLLLSPADEPSTMTLEQPVANTRERNGKPLAWTISPRHVAFTSLTASPKTTTELDKLEREAEEAS